MPTWPATVPQKPQKQGYGEGLEDPGRIRSQMDVATKMRRRASAGVSTMNCVFDCTDAQADTIEDFYVNGTSHGTLAFTWEHPRTGVLYTDKWRFVDVPTFSPVGEGFKVAVQLELLP